MTEGDRRMRNVQVKFGKLGQLHGQILLPEVTHPVPGAIMCHGLGSGQSADSREIKTSEKACQNTLT